MQTTFKLRTLLSTVWWGVFVLILFSPLHVAGQTLSEQLNRYQSLRRSSPDSATLLLQTLIKDYQDRPDHWALGELYKEEGMLHYRARALDDAISSFESSAKNYLQADSLRGWGRSKMNIGIVLSRAGHLDSAYTYFAEARKTFDDLGAAQEQAMVAINLGNLYRQQGDLDNAQKEYRRHQQLATSRRDTAEMLKAWNSLGGCALLKPDLDSAKYYFEEGIDLLDAWGHPEAGASFWQNLGTIHDQQGDYEKARLAYESSLDIARPSKDWKNVIAATYNLGWIANRQGRHREADRYFMEAIEHTQAIGERSKLAKMYATYSKVLADRGQHEEALAYHRRSAALSDSIRNAESDRHIADLREEYEAEQREREIETLNLREDALQADIDKEEAEKELAQSQFYWTLGLSAAVVILLLALLRNYILRQRNLKLANQQASQQRQLELEQVLITHERERTEAVIEGAEAERQRVARELHDRLGSMLSTAKLHAEITEGRVKSQPEKAAEPARTTSQLIDEACVEVRQLAHQMAAGPLAEEGLPPALEKLGTVMRAAGSYEVQILCYGLEERLPTAMETQIYRIVQELVNNVIRHAQAKELTIQVIRRDDSVNLTVEDDGIGFDPQGTDHGLGLASIQRRATSIGGEMQLNTAPGKGTSINIDFPLITNLPPT